MIRALRRLKRLTVKQKMHAGFGVVLVLLAVIASLTLYSLLAIQRSTTRVVEDHQPAVITSMQVAENIKDAIGGLGFYLLSKEDAHKRAYLEHLAQARQLLKRLSTQATIQTNPEAAELVKRIERDVSDFASYQERMFAFATDQAKNFPAMSYSAQNINPLSQQVLQTINSMLRSEEQQASPRLELIKLLNDMRYSWARLMSGIRAYLGFRGQASLDEISNHRELFLARFDRLKKQYGDELTFEQTTGIDELEKLLGSFAEHVDHVIAQHGSDRWRQDAHLFRSEMTPVLNRLNSDVQKLIDQQVDDIEGISQSLTDQATETAIVVIVMLLIAMAAVATLAYLLNKGIIKPMAHAVDSGLQAIGNVMDSFSGPDHASTYQGAAHTDEIDNVANTFHIMADALQEAVTQQREATEELRNKVDVILSTVKRAADGDLTGKLDGFEGSDAIDALARGVRQMIDNLNGLVTQVQQSGIRVTSSATEIAATAKQQEAAIAEQAASTSQIMATVNEISATSKELVNTMREVSDVSENTAQAAGDGHGALEAMESTMQQMREATDSITSKLAVLNEKAGNINNVVTTINKVADQTNLLSLNAAIEAEKAGEYGRGFAVVATEIRRLADQTAVATWDIEQMVKEMQSAVSAGVMGMDKFSEEVTRSVDEVRQVGGQLLQIIEEVQALTPRFDSVNTGMQSQSQAADQISESMTQLNEIAQQTAESVRQSNQSIQQLKDAAQSLQGGVSKFKVSG